MNAPSPALVQELAPTGRLRAAINFGNIVLAQRKGDGSAGGVSVALAHELARRLGLTLELVTYEVAGKVVEAIKDKVWDIAFLAVDPVRATEISFTSPYVLIEGTYLVAEGSSLKAVEDFDREGLRIAVGKGTAYDLFLTRQLKQSELVRYATSQIAIDHFIAGETEAAAGVRQPIEKAAQAHTGYRVIPGRFTAIEQAMALPKGREQAAAYVQAFVEEMKANGFVAEALLRSNQLDAAVAPPAKAG
jgi:polar amino acid transport system substrate-binding protein